jgi:electron transfer flavoprotein alpha subunit
MAQEIFAYINHKEGVLDDSALELVSAAKALLPDAAPKAILTGAGDHLDAACGDAAGSYGEVIKLDADALAYPNAELIRQALIKVLPVGSILLVAHDTLGMDLSPGLSIKMNTSFASDVVSFEGIEGTQLKLIRQEYGGQVSAHLTCDIGNGAVINVRPGAFAPDESKSAGGQVIDRSADIGTLNAKRRFLEVFEAETGDVDITKSEVLVSVGRGIEDEDNIEVAQELAEAVGADMSCSRPIVDAKWLEKSRQVGTSGQTVKPKVYIALGISGSFQHMGGIKGAPFIVAVNKNPKAPIFQFADVGVVEDLLDFVPELTEKIQEM